MKIFLDTADVNEIREAVSYGIIDGVTTNPSLIAKSGRDFKEVVNEICKIFDEFGIKNASISAEVLSTKAGPMVDEALKLSKIHKSITVKIPMTTEGLKATHELARQKVKVNITLVFSPTQALAAAKAGAAYVSPFIGRLDDKYGDGTGVEVLREIAEIYKTYNFKTEIISASIRSISHVAASALAGAHIATIPPKILKDMLKHELTNAGIKKFEEDAAKSKQKI
ncbi:MAG: fructose-6-phosphate aldolase [Candidatus Diapherotrites archaeon]